MAEHVITLTDDEETILNYINNPDNQLDLAGYIRSIIDDRLNAGKAQLRADYSMQQEANFDVMSVADQASVVISVKTRGGSIGIKN